MQSTKLDVNRVCACGCGIGISQRRTDGKPKFYVYGHNRRNKKHPNYIPKLGERHGCWQGGKMINNNGYMMIRTEGHPKAYKRGYYVLEHRLVMEKSLGRYLNPWEDVH